MIIGILLSSQILLLLAGVIIAFKARDKYNVTNALPVWIKVFLSFSLVLSALMIYSNENNILKIYSLMVFMGMLFSFIGDLKRIRTTNSNKSLLAGGAEFGLAHIMYISAFFITADNIGFSLVNIKFYMGIFFYGIFLLTGWILFVGRKKFNIKTKILLACYGSILSLMAAGAASLAWGIGYEGIVLALGSFFFFTSDFLIGLVDFGGVKIKYRNIWVWITYIMGQIGIIYMPWNLILNIINQ